jgi:hypothetical protein
LADMTLLVSRFKVVFKLYESRWNLDRVWADRIDEFQVSSPTRCQVARKPIYTEHRKRSVQPRPEGQLTNCPGSAGVWISGKQRAGASAGPG